MDDFFEKTKKLSNGHLLELAGLCAGMGLLLFAAVFVSNGGLNGGMQVALNNIAPGSQTADIFPCSWFGDCPSFVYAQTFTPSAATVAAGQSVTLAWAIYGDRFALLCADQRGFVCTITPDAPRAASCVTDPKSSNYVSGVCAGNVNGTMGTYTATPSRTTTYYLCSDYLNGYNVGCASATITVPAATPTTLTSFTATPSSVPSGSPSTLAWTGTKGTNFSACELTGGQWGAGAWFTTLPGSIATNNLTVTTTYSMNCVDTTGASTGWHTATVTVTAGPPPAGPCSDIPAQPAVPNGCVTPAPTPGICTPTGGSYSSGTNTCLCPAGQHLQGSACVPNSLCANGLADSYAPTCTCPSGQIQSGSACVTPPPTTCANGLADSYAPTCTCPSGQIQSGSACVLQGVINSLTANPSRVLKGNTATVSWSTSGMTSCSLSSLTAAGTSGLSSTLSSSVSPVINSKTVFTLNCSDVSAASYSSSVTVNLIPITIEQ